MAKIENGTVASSKYSYPKLPTVTKDSAGKLTKDAQDVLRIRAASGRAAQRDVIAALVGATDDATVASVKASVAEALAFLAARGESRKGASGEGVQRAPKSNVVADYFKDKSVGDKIDAADVFFDLDMDPTRVLGSLKRFVSSVKDTSTRVWVSYVKAERAYVISGYGADKPSGFDAYDVEKNAADVA